MSRFMFSAIERVIIDWFEANGVDVGEADGDWQISIENVSRANGAPLSLTELANAVTEVVMERTK